MQMEGFKMRDLSTDELGHVYGAGGSGRNCSPQPPSCGGKSKSKNSKKSKSKHSKSKKHSKSRRYC